MFYILSIQQARILTFFFLSHLFSLSVNSVDNDDDVSRMENDTEKDQSAG